MKQRCDGEGQARTGIYAGSETTTLHTHARRRQPSLAESQLYCDD